jgi:CP family cyanate transporter-like MFS transporter
MSPPKYWIVLGLLWLAGVGLRLTILVVPPVILLIAADLHLSGTEIGILSGLPIVLFGVAALPGSLLISRFGATATLVAGLLVTAIGSALRGAMPSAFALYAATMLMSAGIAIMQPAMPPLVRQWVPGRVTFATAVFTNGILVGQTFAVWVTIPFVLPLVNGSWRAAFAVWSLPVFLIAALTLILAPRPPEPSEALAPTRGWWPDWRNPQVWQLGLIFGSINSIYFSSNAFLPGYLVQVGRSDLIPAALTTLNLCQLPASIALMTMSSRIERRAFPFILSGAVMLVCLAGIVTTASVWTVFFVGGLGFLGAVVLTLGFALPPLLTTPSKVAPMSAAMFTISYTEAMIVSVLSGASWDFFESARFAFLPLAISALPLLFVPAALHFHRPSPSQSRSG